MLKTSTCFESSRTLKPSLKHCAAALALASCLDFLSSLCHAAAGHTTVQKSDTQPSALLTKTFEGARFPIAGITLLSTHADDLLARHSKCQAVTEFNGLGRIVCSQAKFLGGIAGTVLFFLLAQQSPPLGHRNLLSVQRAEQVRCALQQAEKSYPKQLRYLRRDFRQRFGFALSATKPGTSHRLGNLDSPKRHSAPET